MTILIVTDNPLFSIGLRSVIENEYPDAKILETDTVQNCQGLCSPDEAQMMILDVGVIDGKDTTLLKRFKKLNKQASVLVNLGNEFEYIYPFIKAGANGLFSKKSSPYEISKALKTAFTKSRFVSDDIQQLLLADISSNRTNRTLTKRERLLAGLLIANRPHDEIASIAGINPKTVSSYKRRIFEKLRINDITQLTYVLRKLETVKESKAHSIDSEC
ncbi:DNA-binding response regulator [Dyadobacter endophyticus]|uniref:DNA-binding response regulator n=1 Tax=Dyadobacter endophyticus TaxID=1749036 RepID=A0ABQ1ZAM8_9BACT|nr:response regulator transcription factor [Dyadobacter endophyticus]GGH55588.1 DNA-binding response regulator [Dyadobacter endophyticus]